MEWSGEEGSVGRGGAERGPAAEQHPRSRGAKNGVSLREGTLTASVVESDLSVYPDLSLPSEDTHYT